MEGFSMVVAWREASKVVYKEFEPVFKALEAYDKGLSLKEAKELLKRKTLKTF
ncbi:hypothetical protein IPA_09075 [Ignicoccus pacificus DSM 13166]|uniref:Uncharacterized protein n=1 Tax=Ignicoccus pacificus DSM 13166 TaxID=940294 RepID=A0A977KBZ6_9CREN|nr:hypothetical protein IPA_09075 [Ignicoccus pacificus DSM 13166]